MIIFYRKKGVCQGDHLVLGLCSLSFYYDKYFYDKTVNT